MKKQKKVLFVATVSSHIKSFHEPYLKLFQEKGYEVHVASNEDEYIDDICDKTIVFPIERNPYKLSNIKAIKELKKIIDKEQYEIIHCHTPMGGVVARLAAKKSRKRGTRIIYTAHGFHFYKGAPILNWLLYYSIEKYLSKYTDTLITINEEDYSLAKRKFKTKDIKYVPGVGVDLRKFDNKILEKEQNKLKRELGIKKNDFIMLSIGELNDNKNQILQIETMKLLMPNNKNIKLLIAGKGDKKEFLEKKIEEYNLTNNVKLIGFRKDIPQLLKLSNLVLSTSKREGLPVNVIEALASSVPVVALSCRGMSDLINNGKNGCLIDIKSNDKIDKFVSAINNLYNNPDVYNKIKNNCRNSVSNLSVYNILKEMKKIYFK